MSEPGNATETETQPEAREAQQVEQVKQDHEVEIALEALLDDPAPSDWADPAAREQRTETLRQAARCAAAAQVELLAAARMPSDRGTRLRPTDQVVGAMFDALVDLHRAEARYRHDRLDYTGCEIVMRACEAEAGAGVAAIVDALLQRLRRDLSAAMRAGPPA